MPRNRADLFPRLAAPAAFLLAATIGVLVVRSALDAGDAKPARELTTTAADRGNAAKKTRSGERSGKPSGRRQSSRAFYTVQPGDTLETIAADRQTSVERLLLLNPGIDPRSLHTGQRLRIR